MNYPSQLIESAVRSFASLPGIGEKTALRLVLHLLKTDPDRVRHFAQSITNMREGIRHCTRCHNISDHDTCSVCNNPNREQETICVVESIREVMAIENTGTYRGTYHVLGGVISPVDGIGPDQLNIASLMDRVKAEGTKEIIMALSPTMEGDTTMFYLSKQLEQSSVNITSIARGVAFGGELEYTDELTLARSIATRIPFDKQLGH